VSGPRFETTVEELAVDGQLLDPGAREALTDALRRRLGELVAERGLPGGMGAPAERTAATASLRLPAGSRADLLGAELAEALYRELGR